MNSRPFSDFPRNEQGLVDNFIGTAYDVVKNVSDNMPELGRLDDVLAEIPTLADTTVNTAVDAAMIPVVATLDEKIDEAEAQVVLAQNQVALAADQVDLAEAEVVQANAAAVAALNSANNAAGASAAQVQILRTELNTPAQGATTVALQPLGTGAVPLNMSESANEIISVMSFIPANLRAAIRAGTSTTDVTTYVQAAVDYAASRKLPLVFRDGLFTFRRVQLRTNSIIYGNNSTLNPVSGNYALANGANDTAMFEGVNITDVLVTGLVVKTRLANDRCGVLLFDTCERVTVSNNYMEANGVRGVAMRLCLDSDVTRNRIRLGQVAYGCGVEMIHECRYIRVRSNVITGYRVTKPTSGGGIQPSGDLWGSVGISCRISDSFGVTYNGWQTFTGSYQVPEPAGSGPSSIIIPVVGVADDGRWEVASARDLDQITGKQAVDKLPTTIGADTITITNLPINSPGAIITYYALSYKNSPRWIEISDNDIVGMTFAGISLITARDVTASNNRMMSIGDIAWDPEGTMRCHLIGGSIEDVSADGAILAGFGSTVSGVVFKRCGNRGIRVVQPNNAYNYAVLGDTVLPYGLRGNYSITGNTIASTFVGIVVPDKSMGVDISANKVNVNTRGIEIGTGNSFNVSGNDLVGHILATGSDQIAITNNVIRDAYQHNLEIVNCTHFSVQNNTVMRTTANYGGGWGLRYSGSSNGSIKNNTYIGIIAGAGRVAELDSGGNTTVTASGAVVL